MNEVWSWFALVKDDTHKQDSRPRCQWKLDVNHDPRMKETLNQIYFLYKKWRYLEATEPVENIK